MSPGLGSPLGIIEGVAVGAAASAALEPAIELPRQDAWRRNPNRVLDPDLLARLVASGGVPLDQAEEEALRQGYSSDKLDRLVYLAQTVPPLAEALSLWRRGLIDDALFTHVLVKAGLDDRYVAPILALKDTEHLDPAVVALGIVRGLVPDPGILPVGPPMTDGKVPRFPVFEVDALKEVGAQGIDKTRLGVMVGNMGRPASPQEALWAYWRGAIERVDYERAIAEGDVRNEWRDAIEAASRAIPSPHEFIEAWLRGWLSEKDAKAGAAKHGMSEEDAQVIFDILGRPISTHQITTGLARGGEPGGSYDDVPEPYRSAIRESNIRPEWARLDYANRHTYPSAFVLRSIAQAGELTEPETHDALLAIGWPPHLAEKVAKEWASVVPATTDKHVAKAQTQLWTALHKSYVDDLTTDQEATADLAKLGVAPAAMQQVLGLWKAERDILRRSLTAAQIKKAVKEQLKPQAWALERLAALGYSPEDAATLLSE